VLAERRTAADAVRQQAEADAARAAAQQAALAAERRELIAQLRGIEAAAAHAASAGRAKTVDHTAVRVLAAGCCASQRLHGGLWLARRA
jgi:hypothetical protein